MFTLPKKQMQQLKKFCDSKNIKYIIEFDDIFKCEELILLQNFVYEDYEMISDWLDKNNLWLESYDIHLAHWEELHKQLEKSNTIYQFEIIGSRVALEIWGNGYTLKKESK
jgi:hypothetical protein